MSPISVIGGIVQGNIPVQQIYLNGVMTVLYT